MSEFKRGDRLAYENGEYLDIHVTRVAKDGTWIDTFVYDNQALTSWTKRMKLPLSAKWSKRVTA